MPKKKLVENATMGAVGGGLSGRQNLGLGTLRGAGNGAERTRRMNSYLSDVTGDSSYSAPKKKPAPKKKAR